MVRFVLAATVAWTAATLARCDDYQGATVKAVNGAGFDLRMTVQINGQPRDVTLLFGPKTRGVDAAGKVVEGGQIFSSMFGAGDKVSVRTIFFADSRKFGRVEALMEIYPARP